MYGFMVTDILIIAKKNYKASNIHLERTLKPFNV